MSGFFMLDGSFRPATETIVGPDNRGLRFGDGLFETIRHTRAEMPLFALHMERFRMGMEHLGLAMPAHYGSIKFRSWMEALMDKNRLHVPTRIRLMAFRDNGGVLDPVSDTPHLLLQCWPLPEHYSRINENGLVLGVYDGAMKANDGLSNLKHNNFLPYLMAARHARAMHWNDALLLNPQGKVADSTIANLFWVNSEGIFTPPLSDGPVAGCMRRWLLEHLGEAGLPVQERSITPAELAGADEVFLTNAVYGIRSVGRLGDKEFKRRLTDQIYREQIHPLFDLRP